LRLNTSHNLLERTNPPIQLLVLFNHLRRELRSIIAPRAEQRRDLARALIRLAIIDKRARASYKLNACQTLSALPRAHSNHPNFAGAISMCAATRRQIETVNLDQTQITVARRFLSQRQFGSFIRRDVTNRDSAIFPNDIVCQFDGAFDYFARGITQ